MSTRVAIDIGSTVIKIANLGDDDGLLAQRFIDRDYELGIKAQVEGVLAALPQGSEVRICSSANGGLRIGIVCLTEHFSGAVLRNQALLAGANPVFVHDLDHADGDLRQVDALLVGGGVDSDDAGPLALRLDRFDAAKYRHGTLIYAGNRFLADRVTARYPDAVVVPNPLADDLRGRAVTVWAALRKAYLDDLVQKDGVSDLQKRLSEPIRPTPEVVNRGFHRLVSNRSFLQVGGPSILIDIGGATTDIHYTVELIREDSEEKPAAGSSVGRYVFTDLGVFASRDSTVQQMRTHPRLYELLHVALGDEAKDAYQALREGDYAPSAQLLCYACMFLALDRFTQGKEPGLPVGNLDPVAEVVFTGGAPQAMDEAVAAHILALFVADKRNRPSIVIDRDYRLWTEGITWSAAIGPSD